MRIDGKFLVGSDIPEGQGSVNALLAECFDIAYDLRVQAEDNDSEWLQRILCICLVGKLFNASARRQCEPRSSANRRGLGALEVM